MLAKLFSATVQGLVGTLIEVEVDVANRGFPTFTIVGLPNKSIDEAKDRVRTALVNAGYEMPDSRITVNLAPADIPKVGAGFDLPIALGILAADQEVPIEQFQRSIFIGEVSLHGEVRPVPGAISIMMMAKEKGVKNIFLPMQNAQEAACVQGLTIFPVATLTQLVQDLTGVKKIEPYVPTEEKNQEIRYEFDFADVKGQEHAKRGLQIAAAGFHNLHMQGVPGAGKTMLSRAFPSILPSMNEEEVLEVSRIYSATGLLNGRTTILHRPFRSPHHTISRIGLIGGGAVPTPGEISLAHRGVLFLDEFPEFTRSTLEALRQPMEDGVVSISRASGSMQFPCRFLLLAASNACPCGYYGDTRKKCSCTALARSLYKKKLSGPLLDRIDLHVEVKAVEEHKLWSYGAQSSDELRCSVQNAQQKQKERFRKTHFFYNGEMSSRDVKEFCSFHPVAESLLRRAVSSLNLSARSYFKVIKISQTIADLEQSSLIHEKHVAEALQFRYKD